MWVQLGQFIEGERCTAFYAHEVTTGLVAVRCVIHRADDVNKIFVDEVHFERDATLSGSTLIIGNLVTEVAV